MTAEAAAMNKHAVALAADSAVTIQLPSGQKIYNTVNKLFTLSKYAPVGVMIYGNSEFMWVPWETIIKSYRSYLGTQRFETLQDYADNFFVFLRDKTPFITEALKQRFATEAINATLHFVRKQIDEKVMEELQAKGQVNEGDVLRILTEVINQLHGDISKIDRLPDAPPDFGTQFSNAYDKQVNDSIQRIFEKLPVDDGLRSQLRTIVRLGLEVQNFGTAHSGIVFAGFGELDVFPRLRAYQIQGLICDLIRKRTIQSEDIGVDDRAAIIPFAQGDVISTFMEGIDPQLKLFLSETLRDTFAAIPDAILGTIPAGAITKEHLQRLRDASAELVSKLLSGVNEFVADRHIQPIISAVEVLPKDELAAMAESLVNLTSFRRRVSTDQETVGGPIDVAVISKGDGFVWIKRKHYFKPDLNPGFVANYYREVDVND